MFLFWQTKSPSSGPPLTPLGRTDAQRACCSVLSKSVKWIWLQLVKANTAPVSLIPNNFFEFGFVEKMENHFATLQTCSSNLQQSISSRWWRQSQRFGYLLRQQSQECWFHSLKKAKRPKTSAVHQSYVRLRILGSFYRTPPCAPDLPVFQQHFFFSQDSSWSLHSTAWSSTCFHVSLPHGAYGCVFSTD